MNEVTERNDIPTYVFEALWDVRESGEINMFDRSGVIFNMHDYDYDAAVWLDNNKSRYMEALEGMGEMGDDRDYYS